MGVVRGGLNLPTARQPVTLTDWVHILCSVEVRSRLGRGLGGSYWAGPRLVCVAARVGYHAAVVPCGRRERYAERTVWGHWRCSPCARRVPRFGFFCAVVCAVARAMHPLPARTAALRRTAQRAPSVVCTGLPFLYLPLCTQYRSLSTYSLSFSRSRIRHTLDSTTYNPSVCPRLLLLLQESSKYKANRSYRTPENHRFWVRYRTPGSRLY